MMENGEGGRKEWREGGGGVGGILYEVKVRDHDEDVSGGEENDLPSSSFVM